MALIEWREEYCTGIKGVDFEHEALIDQINAVYALIEKQADRDLVIDALGEIYGSISAHFALEEQMMLRHDYVNYQEHKSDHERLLDDIRDIADEYEKSLELDDSAFRRKLADWFQVHFRTHDSRLHNLAGMRSHAPASQSTLKALIQNAKNKLLQHL
ncbi:MAG: hemerythrin family protein [Gammaproteobacteria bacterium]|nr:hemerythrin family protein [Gammaproteobacteria bacterium]MDH3536750.1 hemerythrin family protein [Gammaproteobacteria bacterium]